jgi:hypothetical protein
MPVSWLRRLIGQRAGMDSTARKRFGAQPACVHLYLEFLEQRTLLSFLPAVNYTAGQEPFAVALGDFNNDGIPDLAIANLQSNNISILLGNCDGTFGPPANYAVGVNPDDIIAGDFNHDGNLDLAVANATSNTITVLFGLGNGQFQFAGTYPVAVQPVKLAVGDFNHDGNLDLVAACYNGGAISVLLANHDGTFQPAVNYPDSSGPNSVRVGDFNGDGNLGLAVANTFTDNVSIFLGNGDGTFRPEMRYATGANPTDIAFGDFNGDGKVDLAVVTQHSNNVSILFGNGDGTFGAPVNYAVGSQPRFIVAGDFDHNGKLDLAVTNFSDNDVSVLSGTGTGTFQGPVNYPVGTGPDKLAIGDFNSDGLPDLFVMNPYSNNFPILLNAQPLATHFAISTAASSTAGSPLTVTVSALTSFNTLATNFTGAVHFTSSDPQASLPAEYTFTAADCGVHSFTAILKTAGQQTITVAPILTAGNPVAYYRFEEGSGNQIINSVDGSVAGTHNATYSTNVPVSPIPLTGRTNDFSLQFNNTAALITAQPFIFNNGFGDGTFEFWINAPNQANSGIFWTRADSSDADRFNVYVLSGGVFGFDYREPNGQLHTLLPAGPFITPLNSWTHVAVTRTGNTYRFYENGTLIYTATDTNPNLPATNAWTIGGRAGFPFTGLIDEVRFTNGALAPNQFLNAAQPTPASAVVQVTPAAASTLLVSGYPSPTTENSRHSFTVTAQDAYGNTAISYRGSVHFTSTDRSATLPRDYTFRASDNGVHTFFATFRGRPGTYSLAATDTRVPSITGMQTIVLVTRQADSESHSGGQAVAPPSPLVNQEAGTLGLSSWTLALPTNLPFAAQDIARQVMLDFVFSGGDAVSSPSDLDLRWPHGGIADEAVVDWLGREVTTQTLLSF